MLTEPLSNVSIKGKLDFFKKGGVIGIYGSAFFASICSGAQISEKCMLTVYKRNNFFLLKYLLLHSEVITVTEA